MATRPELQQLLVALLGSPNVYFQPPETVVMEYPCIRYNRENMDVEHANNKLYKALTRYQVTYISRKPDDDIPKKILELPLCSYDRFYTADNLNHDVFRLYF